MGKCIAATAIHNINNLLISISNYDNGAPVNIENFQDVGFWILNIYDSQKNRNTKIIIQKVTKSINVANISKQNQLNRKRIGLQFFDRDGITGNDLLVSL